MVNKEEIEQKYGKIHWYLRPGTKIWIGRTEVDITGLHIFSFDGGKTAYSIFGIGKNELTPEQIDILKKESPIMAEFYLLRWKDTPQSVMDEATSMGYADAIYNGEQDGIMYYKLVPKEGQEPIDTLFLSQDKTGKIETISKMVMLALFPKRNDLR